MPARRSGRNPVVRVIGHHEEVERARELHRLSGGGDNHLTAGERIAAFLVAISRLNECEERDPNIISESLGCGIVADYLKMDLNMFGRTLVELRRRELIEYIPPDREKLDLLVPRRPASAPTGQTSGAEPSLEPHGQPQDGSLLDCVEFVSAGP